MRFSQYITLSEAFTPNLTIGKNEVLVVPGRYSVPHLGHFELFTKSMELFGKGVKELVIAIVMGGKSSEDKNKNPTTFEQRKQIITKGLKGSPFKVTVIQVPDAFPSGIIHRLREENKEPIVYVAGEDRFASYNAIVNKGKESWNSEMEVKKVPMSKRKYAVSPRATEVRAAIRSGDKAAYMKMMPTPLHSEFAKLKKILKEETKTITEAVSKSGATTHLTHLEDYVLEQGKDGLTSFANDVKKLSDFFSNRGKTEVVFKSDGSPSMFFGKNPNNGKFFVATKGLAGKEPKLIYSKEDLAKYGYSGELADILIESLTLLKGLNYKTDKVFQSDILYTSKMGGGRAKHNDTVLGTKYVVFTPNTITYAIPENSPMYNKALKSDMGLVVHTVYDVSKSNNENENVFSLKEISPTSEVKKLYSQSLSSNKVLVIHPFFDKNKETIMDAKLLNTIDSKHKEVVKLVKSIPSSFFDTWLKGKNQTQLVKFLNGQLRRKKGGVFGAVREGKKFDYKRLQNSFNNFLQEETDKEMTKIKTEAGKIKKQQALQDRISDMEKHKKELTALMTSYILMLEIKNIFYDFLQKVPGHIGDTFIKNVTDGSYDKTSGEGFVVFGQQGTFKLVDRLEFSRNNFLRKR